jgi:hypothetical protein
VTYLLDTDIVSNLMRREPSMALIRRLAAIDPEEQTTSSVTLGELVYGTQRMPDRAGALLERIDKLIPEHLPDGRPSPGRIRPGGMPVASDAVVRLGQRRLCP